MTAPLSERAVRALLTVAMGYDNRRSGDLQVAAWIEAAARGRWEFDEAREAIHGHYETSREFVMPADITNRLRVARQQPAPLAAPALPAGSLPSRERIAAHIAEVERHLGVAVTDRDVLRHRCTHCAADPGRRCVNPITGRPLRNSTAHASRAVPPSAGLTDGRTGT